VNTDGKREIVGLHIGCSEAAVFLKSLARRGLRGVKLVISDAHEGLKAAIRRVFSATWQRCRVHWMRNALYYVAKTQQSMVAAALRQAFIQPDCVQASQMLRHVADQLRQPAVSIRPHYGIACDDVIGFIQLVSEPSQAGSSTTARCSRYCSAGSSRSSVK
jgi:putative transposase